jgi:hypothetical protein
MSDVSHTPAVPVSPQSARTTTLAVLQPGYLPWLGFFDQVVRSDVFVYYDDVQFDKHGWRNRNRIKTPSGPAWVTVPVRHKGLGKPRIIDVRIDNQTPWAKKHLGSITQFYRKAPYFDQYFLQLSDLLSRPWEFLLDLDLELTATIFRWLGLKPVVHRASELSVDGERSERLLMLCHRFNAKRYLTGDAASSYLDTALFEQAGVSVVWQQYRHPVYPQLHGNFVPYLSILDLILNVGPGSTAVICGSEKEESSR